MVPIELHARRNWRSTHILHGWERPRCHGETFLCNPMQSGIISYGLFWQMNKLMSFCRWRCMHSRRRRTPNWASAKATVLRWQELYSPNNWSVNKSTVSWVAQVFSYQTILDLTLFKSIITVLIIFIVVIIIIFMIFAGAWQTSIWPWMVQGKKPDGPGPQPTFFFTKY